MAEPRAEGRLFGDISAITLRNRRIEVIRQPSSATTGIRVSLFGTDYPLPGILPLVSPARMAAENSCRPTRRAGA